MKEPKLRFKADDGMLFPDWEEKKIGELGAFTKGAPLSKADISECGTPLILYGELYTTYNEIAYDIQRKTQSTVDEKYYSHVGDVVIPTSGETAEEISTATCVMAQNVILAGDLNIYRSDIVDGRIMSYILNHQAKWKIAKLAQGKSVVHIQAVQLSGVAVKYPPSIVEQQKIAFLFTELDSLIQSAEKELEGYRELKQGMLQKMFPKKGEKVPEIRFPEFTGDWEQRKLGDIADVTKLAGFEFTKHVVYSDEGNIIALRGLNIKNGQLILDDVKYIDGSNFSKLSRSKLFIDDIMFTYVGTVGEVAIIKENDRFYLAPNVSRIRVKSDDSPKFISHYMRTDNFKNKVIFPLIATSSQPALSMENIRKFTINIPTNREEQDRLAKYFDNLDNLITLQQRELDGYKEFKKGLLQQMFC